MLGPSDKDTLATTRNNGLAEPSHLPIVPSARDVRPYLAREDQRMVTEKG